MILASERHGRDLSSTIRRTFDERRKRDDPLMTIPEALQNALDDNDLDTLELEWLGTISEPLESLGGLLKVIDTLDRRDLESRANTLLELLDEQLREQNAWGLRLELIQKLGTRFVKAGHIFDTTIESVRKCYEDRGDELESLLQTVGLDGNKDDTTKLWDKVDRLRNLLIYEIGTVVAMKDKGVGQVVDVNLQLQTLKVDFEKIKGMSVGFRAAGKMLEILPEDHVLYRKLNAPGELQELEPAQLLRTVLESYDRPLSGAEVKGVVDGLVPTKSWTSWWNNARKHPQVIASGGSRQTYTWAGSVEDAEDSAWAEFEGADDARKLELLRRTSSQQKELQGRMVEHLSALGEHLLESEPARAFKIHAALERVDSNIDWNLDETLGNLTDLSRLLDALDTRVLRERAYRQLAELRDDWPEILERRFLGETDLKLHDLLAGIFTDRKPELAPKVFQRAYAQPSKTPGAFCYVAGRTSGDDLPEGLVLRLIKQILQFLSDDNFAPYKKQLEEMCESGGTIPRLISELTENEAAEALAAIERSSGLESYRKPPLVNAIMLKFPNVGKEEEQPLYATAEALAEKREEMRALVEEEIPANRQAIEEARAHGDLRENFEYKSARQRHEYLAARAGNLNQQLERARVLDPAKIDASQVRVGTRLQLEGDQGERTLTILGPWESDPEAGIISYESDLAERLLGLSPGDDAEVEGLSYRIAGIEPFA